MNKKIKALLISLVLVICIVPIYHLKADSGFDGGYSGGSSGGGGFSSGGSGWSSSGSSGSSGYIGDYGIYFLFIVVVISVVVKYYQFMKKIMPVSTTKLGKVPPYNLEELRRILPSFEPEAFKNRAFEIYKEIQIAWLKFDYDTIRKNVTDEMYNMYKAQLTTLKVKNQINFMQEICLINSNIVGMEIKEDIVSLIVTMQVECYDYIANMNGKVLRGTNQRKVVYNYAMTFNKGLGEKINKCPNCGAPLENVNSTTCPYCDSVIINDNYDWVLAKKQVLSQKYK